MPTLSEVQTLLSRYAGAGNTFVDRLNLVRARYLQSGSYPGTKEQVSLPIYSDKDGFSIVTLPRKYRTILAGAVASPNVLCSGSPMGVKNEFEPFAVGGLGYGGLTRNFQEVTGRFAVFQEWDVGMRVRFKFEQSETAGTIYVYGTLNGEDVWALNTSTWEKRVAVAYSGTTTVTTDKYFDAYQFKVQKPVTNGRVATYVVDDDNVETLVGIYEPSETIPKWRRYRVPDCTDVAVTTGPSIATESQFYTSTELDALFNGTDTIAVSSTGSHDLVYPVYFQRRLTINAAAGSGAYIATFLLDNATVKKGGILRVIIDIAQSANPTLKFYNNSLANLLQTIIGDSDNETFATFIFSYDGSNWIYDGRE